MKQGPNDQTQKNDHWQKELRDSFRSMTALLEFLELTPDDRENGARPQTSPFLMEESSFPLRVTRSFAQRMKKKDPQDPLFLQAALQTAERNTAPDFKKDPVGDTNSLLQKGLIQKYEGRALVVTTGHCAIHCRYCFRRHFPYQEQSLSSADRQAILDHFHKDHRLSEIIFSGGDPLLLSDPLLTDWAKGLSEIPHLRRWRLHTRLPSILPSRLTPELRKALEVFWEKENRQVVIVTHINHGQEINDEVIEGLRVFKNSPVTFLNQSVLLKGINDNVMILKDLSEKLFQAGILPYYLHALDRTEGAAHFEVEEKRSLKLYEELCAILPGYLVPKFVREVEGASHKLPLKEQ